MTNTQLFNPQYDSAIFNEAVEDGQFVKLGAADRSVDKYDTKNDASHGICRAQDQGVNSTGEIFRPGGESYAKPAAAAIAKGDLFVVNTDGELIKRNDETSHVGYALEASAANNQDLIRIMYARSF